MPITEVDALADYNLTANHFYSVIKSQLGNLQLNQYIQLQLTALPLDINSKDYPWFSYGVLQNYFDVSLNPTPVSDSLVVAPNNRLSQNFRGMVALGLSLVETKELPPEIVREITLLEAEIGNLSTEASRLELERTALWDAHCRATRTDPGDLSRYAHWSDGQVSSARIKQLSEEQFRKLAMQSALRDQQYADPNHAALHDGYGTILSSASRMRYPRYPDTMYGDEAKKFNVVYFASLSDGESSQFTNHYLITPDQSLQNIESSTIGGFSEKIAKKSAETSRIETDWNHSGSVGYGAFSLKTNVSDHQVVKDDFSHVQNIEVGAKSFMAIKLAPGGWFTPALFDNPVILRNRRVFERYLGSKGSLRYYPTHLIVARGLYIKFMSDQNWVHDYERDFSASGSASARVWGVDFGGGGGYSRHEKSQKIEKRGHELVISDGDENIRILGYVATKNTGFENNAVREFMTQNTMALPASFGPST
ncbi:hypothetical protein E8L99_20890 [Phreatobacter aquaticus]|uniref:Uncharacterized protein n=1 Tax=Phreatobacter aquaticus TaxID=2570229 RepID=A0A4D7QLJ2_9HYPH|nr:hypothetical protein [Phreatobacter aquaticus]QCK88035.1 hypothetical protein E8L99_20890 [Phreatobacter aquaticus]